MLFFRRAKLHSITVILKIQVFHKNSQVWRFIYHNRRAKLFTMCNSGKRRSKERWNEMEEMKYLIGAIDCLKCPHVPPPPSCSIMLPPRIQEVPCIIPPRRPPCQPPPPCCPPISPGPCCPCPLPRPRVAEKVRRPPTPPKCCPPCHPLPCYPSPYCG